VGRYVEFGVNARALNKRLSAPDNRWYYYLLMKNHEKGPCILIEINPDEGILFRAGRLIVLIQKNDRIFDNADTVGFR
jgi:hypothetical protein